jgi:hypothetical protein
MMNACDVDARPIGRENARQGGVDESDARMEQKNPPHRAEKAGNEKTDRHQREAQSFVRQAGALHDPARRDAEEERRQHGDAGEDRRVEERAIRKRVGEQRAISAQAEGKTVGALDAHADP